MNNPIVVLGARIVDGRPSRMLEFRLRRAIEVVALPHSVARVVWRRFVRRVLGR